MLISRARSYTALIIVLSTMRAAMSTGTNSCPAPLTSVAPIELYATTFPSSLTKRVSATRAMNPSILFLKSVTPSAPLMAIERSRPSMAMTRS